MRPCEFTRAHQGQKRLSFTQDKKTALQNTELPIRYSAELFSFRLSGQFPLFCLVFTILHKRHAAFVTLRAG